MAGPTRDGWIRCPPGELDRLAERLRGRRRWRLLLTAGAALVTAAIVGTGLGAAILGRPSAGTVAQPPSNGCHPAPQPEGCHGPTP